MLAALTGGARLQAAVTAAGALPQPLYAGQKGGGHGAHSRETSGAYARGKVPVSDIALRLRASGPSAWGKIMHGSSAEELLARGCYGWGKGDTQ